MSINNMERRLDALEDRAGLRLGKVHQVIVPEGMTDAEREAFEAEATRDFGPNDLVIFRVIVSPPPRPEGAE